MLEFRILGPLEVVGNDGPLSLGGLKRRATLAILLLDANRVVSVERLADDLYAGAAPVTAVTQVQRQISELRKVLGASTIETRAPGYVIRLAPEQLDLRRFERHAEEATRALERGDARRAAALLGEALELWRGPPLADLASEPFTQVSIARLDEIRLAAEEERLEAELALGRHASSIGELEGLVAEHPLRERFHAQLMLALYRSGRQAEALDAYRSARETFVDTFGIEPTPALRELQRAILTQERSLDLERTAASPRPVQPERAILALPSSTERIDALLPIAETLAYGAGRELIVVRLLTDVDCLTDEVSALNARRESISAPSRVAAFTSRDAVGDLVRLVAGHDVELVLIDALAEVAAHVFPRHLSAILERSPADVGIVGGPEIDPEGGGGVYVLFGGSEHDWAALELAAQLALALDTHVTLVGTAADPTRERRDASRMLADASLAVQRVVGIETRPLLVEPTGEALVAASHDATVIVAGISPRWRREGIGSARSALVRDARAPVLIVHRGPRPGSLAPQESRTSFSWSIEAS